MERISLTIEKNLLKEVDEIVDLEKISRSELIRRALEYYIKKYDWLSRIESKMGEITIICNPKSVKNIVQLESEYKHIIIVSLEIPFEGKIIKKIAIKGQRDKIIEFTNKLKGLSNVEFAQLLTISVK
ncbi:putative transcriptional regulator, CopG family [Methanocaldococcus vulcanius M7]|uniref:Transcriptional regulator, CopG family n=1 Tax=Methanocaldococcus vulcanius (strain ATCC 700851 / DSM 12094 / M7) TaxID=579137 RepID=C9RHJ7_METVM|nr:CopG family ribbon-helix-helix protein [Methanocaldococcus vulcanius]ACX73049.1 putative transcriptional regulator, CopG family [Methanocaldococcus vulcanius M7]